MPRALIKSLPPAPTRDAADAYLASEMAKRMKTTDANDTLYQIDSSRDYDPSPYLDKPYVMLGLNVFAADTSEEARLLFTSLQQAFVNLRTGHPGQLPPPRPGYAEALEPRLADMLERVLRCAIVGDRAEIAQGLTSFIAAHAPDEIMVTAQIFDPVARRRSYEILSEIHAPKGA